MKKKLICAILCGIILLSHVSAYAETDKSINLLINKNEQVQRIVDKYAENLIENGKAVGVTAAVASNEKILLKKGYGYADKGNSIKVLEDKTTFRIGSISKTFVALAAVKLKNDGKLDLNKNISDYLPDNFSEFKYPVTMEQLLTHTAGFENMDSGLFFKPGTKGDNLKDFLINHKPEQAFKPGEVAAYSNYGMALAGYVIECITKKPFYEYAEQNIFKPLNMTRTSEKPGVYPSGVVSKGYGTNGIEREEGLVNAYPAGGAVSTALDMGKYIQYLLSGDALCTEMFEKHFAMDSSFDGMGYSWGRCVRNGHTVLCHEGGTDNFTSILLICPDEKLGIFLSCNSQIAIEELTEKILTLLYGEEILPASTTPDKSENIPDISGNYCSTVSAFHSAEKFYSMVNTINISGSKEKGFVFNSIIVGYLGKGMFYHPELGVFRKVEKGGNTYLAMKETYSFVRVHWYESVWYQLLVVGGFVILLVIKFMVCLYKSIRYKKIQTMGMIVFIQTSVAFLIFVKIFMFFANMHYADVAGVIAFLKIAAVLMTLISAFLIVITSESIRKRKLKLKEMLVLLPLNIFSLLFVSWLFQVHLIL